MRFRGPPPPKDSLVRKFLKERAHPAARADFESNPREILMNGEVSGFVNPTESEARFREQRFFAFLEISFGVSKKQGIRAKSVGRCRGALHGKRR